MNKRKIKIGILISGILLFGLVGLLSNDVKATTDIDYTFERNTLYESTDPIFTETENIRNQTEYTGLYNGTYSFTEDSGSTVDEWTFEGNADTSLEVLDSLDGHDKVVNLSDSSVVNEARMYQDITPQTDGRLDFWLRTDNVGLISMVEFITADSVSFLICFRLSKFQYQGVGWVVALEPVIADTWYHISIDFDCGTDTFDFYINKILEVDDGAFINLVANVDEIGIRTWSSQEDYSMFIDGIGYSWDDDYDVNDNIIPISIDTGSTEIDKWEFAHLEDGTYIETSAVVPFWDEINGAENILYAGDQHVIMESDDTTILGVSHEFDELEGVIDITWDMKYLRDSCNLESFYVEIYSEDLTLITKLRFLGDGTDTDLSYYDGVGYNDLFTGLEDMIRYSFYLYIDVLCSLNGSSFGRLNNAQGLGRVKFYGSAGVNGGGVSYQEIALYNIGVYLNGTSLSNDFGMGFVDFDSEWDSNIHNIINVNATGNFTLDAYESHSIKERSFWNNSNYFFNEYGEFAGDWKINVGGLLFSFNESITVNYIDVFGVSMIEGINNYSLEYTHGNVNPDESYFYVSGNHLYYSITYNDTDLEYIQASFDISNVLGENRSVRYYSDTNGNYAEMRMKYTDTTVMGLALQTSYYISNLILNQDKNLDYIQLLITDDDKFNSGTTTGRVSGITLEYLPNIQLTITTLDLLGMITVLIIIIIPTLVIARKIGSVAIIPMLFLMCFLCVATELIPIWLFVVITISLGSFYIVNSKMKGGM